MRRIKGRFAGLLLLSAGIAFCFGCGERPGGYTYETTLVDTLDVYVHPLKPPTLELTPTHPKELESVDALRRSNPRFARLPLSNIQEEHRLMAVVDGPPGETAPFEVLVDLDGDLDLSDEERYRLHPYAEGSPYYLSDTLVVSYLVDTAGVRNPVERKLYFILKHREEEESLRYDLIGHRVGSFDHLGGEPYPFVLADADYNGYYDHRDLLVIDTNRDGVIDGNRNSVERYSLGEAFLLGDRPYRVVGINQEGIRFSILPYKGRVIPRDRLEIGDPAPDFTLADLSGEPVRFSQFSGKTVLLVFWASG